MEPQRFNTLTPVAQLLASLDTLQQHGSRFAANTIKSYGYDWRMFRLWCDKMERTHSPATTETVLLFLVDMIGRGNKIASVKRRASAIAYHHRQDGHASPVTPDVHEMMANLRRSRAEHPRQKKALTVEELRRIAEILTVEGSPRSIRDRAILVVGFASALRRSNLVTLEVGDLEFVTQGAVLAIRREKNDQRGRGREIGIPFGKHAATCPVTALHSWIEHRGSAAGRLFTRVDPRGLGLPMHPQLVAKALKRAVVTIGLDPGDYGAHSLRSGLVTAGAEAGASELVIAAQTGHQSLEVLRAYFRRANLFRANAAGMIGL
jgi:site-specific recombinase XerD